MSKVVKFKGHLPKPDEVGVTIPKTIDQELFKAGWEHGLVSNKLLTREHLKASFREGFRAAKLYIRQLYADRGISVLPMTARVKVRLKDK